MIKRTSPKALALCTAVMAAVLPGAASAESNFQTGAGALTSTAKVDFQITIPKILFLQVGSGALYTTLATVNLIDFTVPAANVGNDTAVTASALAGDLGNGVVTAIVRGNNGNITLNATSIGALSNGAAGDSINWSQITTTAAPNTTGTVLTAPTLTNGVSGNVTLSAVAKVVNQDAKWTYKYANSALVAAGTYGGVNVNNSRVTYTATLP